MRIAYTNLIDAGSAPTTLTEDLLYPEENLQNQRLAKRWRSTDPSAQTIVCNLGSAQAVNTIAILGHNISSAATLTIEAHTSDSWGSPSYTTSLTYTAGAILKYLSAAQTYQYWRFTVDDGSNADGYVEVGRFWLGDYISIDPSSLYGFTVTKRRSDQVVYGRDRQKFATEGVGWRRFSFSFPRTGGTALTNVLTMIDTVGAHGSVIFSNFDSIRTYEIVEPCLCSIVGDVTFSHARFQKYRYSMVLEEDR